jgi:hypothetical protein
MVYGYSCSAAVGRPEVQAGTGFQTETLLGYQRTKRGNICMPLKRRPQRGRVNVGIRARCGTGRACLTVSGLAVAKIGLKARPPVAVTPRAKKTGATPGGPMNPYPHHERRASGRVRSVCRTCGAQVYETHHIHAWGGRMRLLVCLGPHCGIVTAEPERRRPVGKGLTAG